MPVMEQTPLTIMEGVEPAIDQINAHDHSGGLGSPIPTGGIANGAVTGAKVANGAIQSNHLSAGSVSNTALAAGSVSLSKLSADIGLAINGGALTITDYIGNGMKVLPNFSALNCTVTSGRSNINEKFQQLTSNISVNLSARKASLLYATKSGANDAPTVGKVDASYPPLDSTHVARWIFNNRYQDTKILDTTTNANHLIITGGTPLTDGWLDYGIKFDGTTGYMKSTSNLNLPIGQSPREMTILVTPTDDIKPQSLVGYGPNSAANMGIWINNGRWYIGSGDNIDTGVKVYPWKTYCVTLQYTGREYKFYVNGYLMFRIVADYSQATNTNNFVVGGYPTTPTLNLFLGIMHYVEVRKICSDSAQIAQMSNNFLLPCRYTASLASFPSITTPGSHVWTFNYGTASTVLDTPVSATALNGVAHSGNTGLQLVPSDLLLGQTIRFNGGANDYYDIGSLTTPSEFTVTGVAKLNSYAAADGRTIFSNYNAANPTKGFIISVKNNVLSFYIGSLWYYATTPFPLNTPTWFAITYKDGIVNFYYSPYSVDAISTYNSTAYVNGGGNAYIGSYNGSTCLWQGTMEYLAFIPKVYTTAELANIYNSLMNTGKRSIREDVLPANSITLGFVRTDGTRVIECNDNVYVYGRRESPDRTVRMFSGWNNTAVSGNYYPENPFQTPNVRIGSVVVKGDAEVCRMSLNDCVFSDGSGEAGTFVRDITPFNFHITCGNWGPYFNADTGGSLYGFYMEVDE